jgi:hypothetical protein
MKRDPSLMRGSRRACAASVQQLPASLLARVARLFASSDNGISRLAARTTVGSFLA